MTNEVTVMREGLRCNKCSFEIDGIMSRKCPDCGSNLFVRQYWIKLERGARLRDLRDTKTNKIGIYTGEQFLTFPPCFAVKYEDGTYGSIPAGLCMLIEED